MQQIRIHLLLLPPILLNIKKRDWKNKAARIFPAVPGCEGEHCLGHVCFIGLFVLLRRKSGSRLMEDQSHAARSDAKARDKQRSTAGFILSI